MKKKQHKNYSNLTKLKKKNLKAVQNNLITINVKKKKC